MTRPMQPQPNDAPPTGPFTWIVGAGILTLAVVMILAATRYDDTESVSTAPATEGATPEQIATGQTALAAVGCYTGEIDGQYGGLTDQAILDFQQASGLAVDGLFGPDTLAALETAVAQGRTVCTTDTSTTDTTTDTSGGEGTAEEGTDASTEGDGSGETIDTQLATLQAPSYGPKDFIITSWDCTGGDGDLVLQGADEDAVLTIAVAATDGLGTLAVDGGDEQDGITLNGDIESVVKEPGGYIATGIFGEPNNVGDEFTLAGTC